MIDEDADVLNMAKSLLGRRGPVGRATEEAALLSLPEELQRIVAIRALVLDRLLAAERRTKAAAEAAAAELGVSRSALYRMLDRYASAGMVGGLTPNARVDRRRRPEFGDRLGWADRTIEDGLAAGRALREIVAEVGLMADRLGYSTPSLNEVRKRAAAVRWGGVVVPRASAAAGGALFGRSLLVDQCALDEWVAPKDPSGRPDMEQVARAVATFVLDEDTGQIVGAGVDPRPSSNAGLVGAVAEARTFLGRPLIGDAAVAHSVERVVWVVPEGAAAFGERFVARCSAAGIEGEAVTKGERRHGVRLTKRLGFDLGDYRLMPRKTARPRPVAGEITRPEMIRGPTDVGELLAIICENWNLEIVRRRQGARLADSDAVRARRIADWTRGGVSLDLGDLLLGERWLGTDPRWGARAAWTRRQDARLGRAAAS